MSRLAETFAALRKEGRPGLVTYVTAGDPDLTRSAEIVKALKSPDVAEKLMGLVLTAIAVEMILAGLKRYFLG